MLRSYLIDEFQKLAMEMPLWNIQIGMYARKTIRYNLFRETWKIIEIVKCAKDRLTAATAGGFGPQIKVLGLNIQDENLNSKMDKF
jgi:uridine phosphorylase